MKTTLFIIIITTILFLMYSFGNSSNNIEQEQYVILKKIDNIEIRQYRESVNASYYSEEKSERNNYFRNLAGYIFGDNDANTNIDMTSPVTMKLYGNREMMFRMPKIYTIDNLPKANNPKINFLTINPSTKRQFNIQDIRMKILKKRKYKN